MVRSCKVLACHPWVPSGSSQFPLTELRREARCQSLCDHQDGRGGRHGKSTMSIHWIWLPYNNHIIFSSIHPEYTQDTFGYAMHFAHCAYGRKETGTLHRLGAAPAVGCLSGRLLMPPQPPPNREVEGMVLQAENRREHRIPKSS